MSTHALSRAAASAASDSNMCYGYGGRRYFTREERKAWLEDYANQLENELKAVRERIQEISSASA